MGSERELIEQLPSYFRPVLEFQELMRIHGGAVDELEDGFQKIRDNLYIFTCDSQTLAYYEGMMQLSGAGKTLEERRQAVLLQWGMQALYTLPKLREILAAAVGSEHIKLICDYADYRVTVVFSEQDTALILGLYDIIFKMVPAHIVLIVCACYLGTYPVPISYQNTIRFWTEFYPRYNLGYLHLDGTWKLDGTRRLSGYDSDEVLDFYPVGLRLNAGGAAQEITAKERLQITAGAKALPETGNSLRVQAQARTEPETEQGLRFCSGAALLLKTRSYMTKQNRLDGAWKLDGSRKLDGGKQEL